MGGNHSPKPVEDYSTILKAAEGVIVAAKAPIITFNGTR